ncbi:MAG: DUF401 family protein [Spirochaetales bacterium]|nr:DUF401 family protein [Spirochaetales bacterium]
MLDLLFNVPVILKIIVSLASIIIFNKFLSNQIYGVIAGTVILAVWANYGFHYALTISWNRFSEIDNIFLLLVVFFIMILSSQMKESGLMDELVNYITGKYSRNKSIAILPAVIGLLPMPGGALFSAPLVGSCDVDNNIDASLKTRINYWFRHIWEYWWPLYPGVLLAIDISNLPVLIFIAALFPVTIISAVGAWFFLLRRLGPDVDSKRSGSIGYFLFLISPILIIISVYFILSAFVPVLSDVSKYLPIAIGIFLSGIYLQIIKPLSFFKWKKLFSPKNYLKMVVLVALIRIYGAFIEGRLPDGTFLMETLRAELSAIGISPYLLIMLIPFICGISTGIAIGTVGAAFPIVISLIGTSPDLNLLVSTTVLAYTFGHAGQLLSPVHVCLLVSNEYFKVSLGRSLVGLIKPVLVVLAAGFFLSRLYMGVL